MNVGAAIDIHRDSFSDAFHLPPDKVYSWGGNSDESAGFDDGTKGVQWNTGVNWYGGRLVSGDLGVNLEGNKYDEGRPVERLIRCELRKFDLFKIIESIEHPENIRVRWTRDVWANRRMRLAVQPFLYVPLSELREDRDRWEGALGKALSCLSGTGAGCNRAVQMTTVNGVTTEREVTPHLTFIFELWRGDPVSKANLKVQMQEARRQLCGLHREMGVLSQRT